MDFIANYGLFLIKTVTMVVAIIAVLVVTIGLAARSKDSGKIKVKKLNDRFQDLGRALDAKLLSKLQFKSLLKQHKKSKKSDKKRQTNDDNQRRIFLLEFDGDLRASAVAHLREEITAVLLRATKEDEVVVKLESPGGAVNGYGLAASQLSRIREREIPLTIIVDKVAASGGYMMACVANKLIAAPFSIIGSIGVIAQIPNFSRLLDKHKIDFEQVTAGQYKRTLTMFGKNTDTAREKMQQDIGEIHTYFKEHIAEYRPQLDMDAVATGEYWLGRRAFELELIDALGTSDDYLMQAADNADIYEIKYKAKKSLSQKLSDAAQLAFDKINSRGSWLQ